MKSSMLKLGAFVFILGLVIVGVKVITTSSFFSDTETSTSNTLSAAESFCSPGTVFQIGDIEDGQMDNPVDELNWPEVFGVFPTFPDPFVVGTNADGEFPWNSNKVQTYAIDFDVQFQMPEEASARLTISWAPGRSGNERKEVLLDGSSVDTTPTRLGTSVAGWWEQMQRFEDSFDTTITYGQHTFTFLHPIGDGTLWDWVKLEITECPSDP